MIKKILKIVAIVIAVLLVAVMAFFWHDANSDKYDVSISDDQIPVFTPISMNFEHVYSGDRSLPIVASAVIDLDNDGVDELFLGGGLTQSDALFRYTDQGLENITAQMGLGDKGDYTTIAAATADFDSDGYNDLMVSREDGLHIYYNRQGKFEHKRCRTPLNEKSTPAGITLGDIDRDGDLDVFLSTYIKKELMEGQTKFEDKTYGATSALLLNDGSDDFDNITTAAGLDYIHNTFMGILVDIDGDGDLDLVVAHDTGEVRTYSNNGDKTFTMMPNPLSDKFAYPMGIAAGDYNNDGRVDFMFSNTGSTLPRMLAKGDIKDASRLNEKWILFRNDGDFKFTDVADEVKIANYEFSWGAVFADMNNDGLQDLMVAENYVDLLPNKLFRLPSRMLIQKADGTFAPTEAKSAVIDPHYAITPLVTDFNNDGALDMVWVNINSPSLAYLNKGGQGNYLKVILSKTALNIGAKVEVRAGDKVLTDWLMIGEGLASDQSGTLHFGLGTESSIDQVTVTDNMGNTQTIDRPEINSTLRVADFKLEKDTVVSGLE